MSEKQSEYKVSSQDLQDALAMLGNQETPEHPIGFASPNFTQTPNDLFETMMKDMEETELKVVLAIVRQTYGYHRVGCKIGINDLAKTTGLSYAGVVLGAKAAEKRGIIRRTNPESKTKAEWEVIETPSAVEGLKIKHPQSLGVKPSAVEGQVGLNKDKEKSDKEREETRKNILAKSDIGWLVAGGASKEEIAAVLEREKMSKDATDSFERDLAFNPLQWSKNSAWNRFRKFVVEEYSKDPDCFKKFRIKRDKDGQFSKLPSNPKIYQDPDILVAIWPSLFSSPECQKEKSFSL